MKHTHSPFDYRFKRISNLIIYFSSVKYPAIWRCEHISRGRSGVSCGRCGCECGGCASSQEMIHLQSETTAPPVGDAVPPVGDLLASPNFGICDITHSFRQRFEKINRALSDCSRSIKIEYNQTMGNYEYPGSISKDIH